MCEAQEFSAMAKLEGEIWEMNSTNLEGNPGFRKSIMKDQDFSFFLFFGGGGIENSSGIHAVLNCNLPLFLILTDSDYVSFVKIGIRIENWFSIFIPITKILLSLMG